MFTSQAAIATNALHAQDLHEQNIPFLLIMDPCSPGYDHWAELSQRTIVTSCGDCAGERSKGHFLSCATPQLSSYTTILDADEVPARPYVFSPCGEILLHEDRWYSLYVDSYPYRDLTWYEVAAHYFDEQVKSVVLHDLLHNLRVHLPIIPKHGLPNHMANMTRPGFRLWAHG